MGLSTFSDSGIDMGKWCLANFTCQEVCQRGTVSGIIPNLATALAISQYFALVPFCSSFPRRHPIIRTYAKNLARLEDEKPDCHLQNWDSFGWNKTLLNIFFCDLLFFLEVDSLSHMVPQAVDPSPNWHHWIGFREPFTGDFNLQWEHLHGFKTIVFPHLSQSSDQNNPDAIEDRFSPVSTYVSTICYVGSLQ